jgi:hypothetical protein
MLLSKNEPPAGMVARLVWQILQEGQTVEIDGLGTFWLNPQGGVEFTAFPKPIVFLAYVVEDVRLVQRLYSALQAAGADPWMDRKKLLPGQNWPRSIERAIAVSDYFIPCFSRQAVGKRGQFQSELRYALDCARGMPLDQIFLIPVRLENCVVPRRIQRETQYVDLFPDWAEGVARVVTSIRSAHERKPNTIVLSRFSAELRGEDAA